MLFFAAGDGEKTSIGNILVDCRQKTILVTIRNHIRNTPVDEVSKKVCLGKKLNPIPPN